MNRNLVSYDGLVTLSRELKGDETIGMGIRPFGFHAGNMASIMLYPIILCDEIKRRGKIPQFHFDYWFNDIEQHETVGPDGTAASADGANIYPAGKTLQFTPGPDGFNGTIVNYWQPLIENAVSVLGRIFPHTHITFHRTSEMRTEPAFEKTVIGAINSSSFAAKIITDQLGIEVKQPAEFVRAVCPGCNTPAPNTKVEGRNTIVVKCNPCHRITKADVSNLNWWIQFRMLTIPRLQRNKPYDVRIMGVDHLSENSTTIGEDLTRLFGMTPRDVTILHAPMINAADGQKMSKSRGNVAYALPEDMVSLLHENTAREVSIGSVPHSGDIRLLARYMPRFMDRPEPFTYLILRMESAMNMMHATGQIRATQSRNTVLDNRRPPRGWLNPHL